MLHERVLDVAGTIAWLRDRGFRRVVLGARRRVVVALPRAGGEPRRIGCRAPSGDAVPLHETEMPAVDGFVLLAAHLGEGRFLLDRLDPSIVDESDPVATDPRLDMYDPRNGYRPMQDGPSSYAPEFLAAFRAAQHERCARLDARAIEWCEEVRWYRRRLGTAGDAPPAERTHLARHAMQRRYFLIYRTLPTRAISTRDSTRRSGRWIDLPSDATRWWGTTEGLARTMSARGWLSTWSGLRSNAALERTMPGIAVPTLVVCAMADLDIYPSECRLSFERSGASDKQWAELAWAGHYLYPVGPEGGKLPHPQDRVADEVILPWLRQRWPA